MKKISYGKIIFITTLSPSENSTFLINNFSPHQISMEIDFIKKINFHRYKLCEHKNELMRKGKIPYDEKAINDFSLKIPLLHSCMLIALMLKNAFLNNEIMASEKREKLFSI